MMYYGRWADKDAGWFSVLNTEDFREAVEAMMVHSGDYEDCFYLHVGGRTFFVEAEMQVAFAYRAAKNGEVDDPQITD